MRKATHSVLIFCFLLFTIPQLLAQEWEGQAEGILPVGYGVFDVAVVDENVVWGVAFDQLISNQIPGNHTIKVIKTVDGGTNWEVFDIENAKGRISFDIEAFDAEVAFITTQDFGNGNGKGVFKTEDGGLSWTEKLNNLSAGVWIRFFDELEGIVINRQAMAKTLDGGESWQFVHPANIPNYDAQEFTIVASGNNSCITIGDNIWFGTNMGRVFRSTDRGNNWEAFDAALGNSAVIKSIAFSDELKGMALNTSLFYTTFSRTKDGGTTWEKIEGTSNISVANIEHIPGTEDAFVAASDRLVSTGNQSSVFTTDYGNTWTEINDKVGFAGIEFISPTVGWASKGEIIFASDPAIYMWQGNVFTSSSSDHTLLDLAIFPNPFNNHINLSSSADVREIRWTTMDGTLIHTQTPNQATSQIWMQDVDPGIYILHLITTEGQSFTRKLIKAN